MITTILGSLALIAGLMVITDNNTIHSVFYLVLVFIISALLLISQGIDYFGLLLIIVYVGAIAILFLFVVMMINIKQEENNRTKFVPIGLLVALVFIFEIYSQYPSTLNVSLFDSFSINGNTSNLLLLGNVLFTWETILYASLVLLVAMIGAIVLTLSHTEGVKRQDLFSKW